MKKFLAVFLTFALLCALSIPAFAASPITSEGGSDSSSVKGTYVSGSGTRTVYSVDITWGSMEFTYTDASSGTWNPLTHSYTDGTDATWSCETGANKITVTNHSNVSVKATFGYTAGTAYTDIRGAFSESTLTLDSAVGTTFDAAPEGSTDLTLTGALPESTTEKTVIGTVTVTLGE